MTRLTAVTPYGPVGASARVRVYDWTSRLALQPRVVPYIGASNASPRTLVTHAGAVLVAERRLRALDLQDDVLLLHREASPLSRGTLEEVLLRRAKRSLYDVDDALQWETRRGLRNFAPKSVKADICMRGADVVIAGSDLLADYAGRFARDVVMVPSCVDVDDYVVKPSYDLGDPPRIGWVGSPSAEGHLRLVTEPLLALHRRTGARLVVVSAGDASLGALDPMVDRVAWTSTTVAASMAGFDVAIAPLVSGLYARGKCSYKILQYGASGLPTIGSPVGANRTVLGRLGAVSATASQEWADGLEHLLSTSASERAAMGATARQQTLRGYSFGAWESVMRGLLDAAGAGVRPAPPDGSAPRA